VFGEIVQKYVEGFTGVVAVVEQATFSAINLNPYSFLSKFNLKICAIQT